MQLLKNFTMLFSTFDLPCRYDAREVNLASFLPHRRQLRHVTHESSAQTASAPPLFFLDLSFLLFSAHSLSGEYSGDPKMSVWKLLSLRSTHDAEMSCKSASFCCRHRLILRWMFALTPNQSNSTSLAIVSMRARESALKSSSRDGYIEA